MNAAEKAIMDRIMEKVEIIPWTGCWIWMGSTQRGVSPRIFISGKAFSPRKVAFEIDTGTTTEGLGSRNWSHTCGCSLCINPYHIDFVFLDKEKRAEYQRAYNRAMRAANKEKLAEKRRAMRAANKEKLAERNRAYYAANKDKEAERNRAYRAANKDKEAERNRAYRARKKAEKANA